MQPYQEASERARRIDQKTPELLKKAGSLALTAGSAYVGAGAVNKVLPFLSKYIPEGLAIAGLNKLDPRWGKFFKNAMSEGYEFDEIKDFLSDKMKRGIEGKEEPQEKSKENRNIIEQYSPELHQFIDQEVRKGRPLIQAGALAQNNPKFAQVIDKLQKDHKTPWSKILQSIYGGALQEQPQDQRQMQQPQQGGGQGQNRLASVLQQYMQMKGGQ